MVVKFHANCVSVNYEDDYLLVGFADDKFDTKEYLMLQRAYKFDEQDVRLGMDDVYIERNGQGWSTYGGILKFELDCDRVSVLLDENSSNKMSNERQIEVTFSLPPKRLRELRKGLAQVFEGRKCFVDNAM